MAKYLMNSPELPLGETKLFILKRSFNDYNTQFDQIQRHINIDNTSALLVIAAIIEDILFKIWISRNPDDPKPSTLMEVLSDDRLKSEIPKNILNQIHNLRIMGNIARHERINVPTNIDDLLLAINMFFNTMNWYGTTYLSMPRLNEAVEPNLTFRAYINQIFTDRRTLVLILLQTLGSFGLIRFHQKIPTRLNSLFENTYEGIFDSPGEFSTIFTLLYTSGLVGISLILAWSIFKEFRKQQFKQMIYSFELMFSAVFSLQFIILAMLDLSTHMW